MMDASVVSAHSFSSRAGGSTQRVPKGSGYHNKPETRGCSLLLLAAGGGMLLAAAPTAATAAAAAASVAAAAAAPAAASSAAFLLCGGALVTHSYVTSPRRTQQNRSLHTASCAFLSPRRTLARRKTRARAPCALREKSQQRTPHRYQRALTV